MEYQEIITAAIALVTAILGYFFGNKYSKKK